MQAKCEKGSLLLCTVTVVHVSASRFSLCVFWPGFPAEVHRPLPCCSFLNDVILQPRLSQSLHWDSAYCTEIVLVALR